MRCTSPHLVPNGVRDQKQVPVPFKPSCEIGKPKSVCTKLTRISSSSPTSATAFAFDLPLFGLAGGSSCTNVWMCKGSKNCLTRSFDSNSFGILIPPHFSTHMSSRLSKSDAPSPNRSPSRYLCSLSLSSVSSPSVSRSIRNSFFRCQWNKPEHRNSFQNAWHNCNVFILHSEFNPPALQSSEKPELRLNLHKTIKAALWGLLNGAVGLFPVEKTQHGDSIQET